MKRGPLLVAGGLATVRLAVAPLLAAAAAPTTIIWIKCSIPSLDDDAEDFLAGELRSHDVPVFDPSAIRKTTHRKTIRDTTIFDGNVNVNYSVLKWVTTEYHARRLLGVRLTFTHTSLPYGEFKVYNVRARASYRCLDVISREIVTGGTALGIGKAEDLNEAQDDSAHDALSTIAEAVAEKIR